MDKKAKKKNIAKPGVKGYIFLKTQILTVIVAASSLLIAAAVCYNTDAKIEIYFYPALLSFAIASFAGGYYSGHKIRQNGLATAALFCLPLNLLAVFLSFVMSSFKADLTLLITLTVLIICSMLGGVISVNTKAKVKVKRK